MRELEIKCRIVDKVKYISSLQIQNSVSEENQHNWYYRHPDLKGVSYRTRSNDPDLPYTYLIQKYGSNPINGQDRMEISVETGLKLSDIHTELIGQGFQLDSQWYRERVTYDHGSYFVEHAINSGFGYIIELEAKNGYDLTVMDLCQYAEKLGLEPISTEQMDKAYSIIANDPNYYIDFVHHGRRTCIDWDNL